MLDEAEYSLILDVLGNRNRRRIIELLRDKPCFVTEISTRLMISPKAVIDHLQILQNARILTHRQDEKRRKYYYLARNINIQVQLEKQEQSIVPLVLNEEQRLMISLQRLRTTIRLRSSLISQLEETERSIDQQIEDLLQDSNGERAQQDLMVSIALAHDARDAEEISEMIGADASEVRDTLERLTRLGVAGRKGSSYTLRGIYAE